MQSFLVPLNVPVCARTRDSLCGKESRPPAAPARAPRRAPVDAIAIDQHRLARRRHRRHSLRACRRARPHPIARTALVAAPGSPVVLTAIESEDFKGDLFPELLELFPEETPIERSTMNSWDSADFVAAVKKTGRRNLVIAALWTEVCLAMPALQALTDGYFVFAVEDASGGMSLVAHHAALRRIEQAGAVSVTALQVLLEFQRDWARNEHYDEVMDTLKAHCSIYAESHHFESQSTKPQKNNIL